MHMECGIHVRGADGTLILVLRSRSWSIGGVRRGRDQGIPPMCSASPLISETFAFWLALGSNWLRSASGERAHHLIEDFSGKTPQVLLQLKQRRIFLE